MPQYDFATDAIIDRYRNLLPQARGRHLSSLKFNEIISQTIEQCPLLLVGDSSWLDDSRNKAGLVLNAFIYGDKKRDYGGIFALTHPVRTAHRAFNFGPKNGYPQYSLEAAFVALSHDTCEDAFKHRTQATDDICIDLIMDCFVQFQSRELGGARYSQVVRDVRHDLLALTDGRDLSWQERFEQQLARVEARDTVKMNYSFRAMIIRYLEQLDTREGDLAHRLAAPDADSDNIMHFVDLAKDKLPIIEAMSGPIGEEEKSRFRGVIAQMEQLARDRSPARAIDEQRLRETRLDP